MKKSLLVFAIALISVASKSQDTITLHHKSYSTTFSKSKHYPVKVEWWLTKAMLVCENKVKRTDKFGPDPKLPIETNLQSHYNSSGFDRGHNFNAADGACDQVSMEESFYFSNMTAQYPSLNRGDWKSLESWSREQAIKLDSIHIWCGSIGSIKKIGETSVPAQCWKVIYIKTTNQWLAYLFNNDTTRPDGIDNNKVDLITIEKLTGFKFKL